MAAAQATSSGDVVGTVTSVEISCSQWTTLEITGNRLKLTGDATTTYKLHNARFVVGEDGVFRSDVPIEFTGDNLPDVVRDTHCVFPLDDNFIFCSRFVLVDLMFLMMSRWCSWSFEKHFSLFFFLSGTCRDPTVSTRLLLGILAAVCSAELSAFGGRATGLNGQLVVIFLDFDFDFEPLSAVTLA